MTVSLDISNQIISKTSNSLRHCSLEGCNKKIKLSDYPCKCEKIFCRFHRQPNDHNCEYDYKELNLQKEKIDNLKCISNKIQKLY